MSESCADFLPLRVTKISVDGKRSFDKCGKQQLIEACLQPGVSIAGMALKAGVNANQLWRWIDRHKVRQAGRSVVADTPELPPAVFVPAVKVSDAGPMVVSQQPEQSTALQSCPQRQPQPQCG